MAEVTHPDNRYWAPVDPEAPNNAHAWSLQLIGANKRVLELGPAAGAFTAALRAQGCRVVAVELDPDAAGHLDDLAERVIVGDLGDPAVLAQADDGAGFDVVVAGDVLEHLADPLATLQACRPLLRPGGYVVLSVPNVAHADLKLQMLDGRFAYRDTGLLDRTHLHLFTLESLQQMVRDAGLLLTDLRRVVVPVFGTEQAVPRESVDDAVLALVLAAPESETYQFVARALLHDGDAELARLAERVVALRSEVDEADRARARAEEDLASAAAELAEVRSERDDLRRLHDEAVGHARGFEEQCRVLREELAAIKSSRSHRLLAPLRSLFARRP